MNDEQMRSLLDMRYRDLEIPRPKVQTGVARVMADVQRIRQQGRWWPLPAFGRPLSTFPTRELVPASAPAMNGRMRPRGSTMFSAVKFVAAGAIVALFGGFLLAGVLTTQQGDEVLPAAVTDSPAPEATSEPTEAPTTSVRTDILPGVALNVEEVEPGVLWVRNDGLSAFAFPVDWEVPYDIVAGHDGGIYVLEPGHYARLGQGGGSAEGHKGFDWNIVDGFPSDVGVAPDGTIWAVFSGRLYSSPWGSGYETRHLPTMVGPEPIEVTSDGTVWAVWRDDSGSAVFGYLGALAAYRESADWLSAQLDYLRANRDLVEQSVAGMPGLEMAHVEATYLAWIDAGALDVKDPQALFLEHGVALSPGAQFGAAGFVRLNFGTQRSRLAEALRRMTEALAARA